ncbi:hypothetical protein [Haloarchaeobius amylolyticus]|uniref:hypothetical protein n=1 Tax=Haloarchaeobius amylolyticus TaxID=1198296 RepID=UPI00226E4600|nr:hypothetical protein [Haloarchaeobius amylolyticus]
MSRIRRPEYTGENRCIPCTVTNLAIAAVLTGGSVLLWPPAAVGVAAFSLGMIYFRGYLVPGTPELTKRYFPDWLLRVFDKEAKPRYDGGEFDMESTLLEAGIIEETPDQNDVMLTPTFAAAWAERMAHVAARDADIDELAGLLGVEEERLAITEHGSESFIAWVDGEWLAQWESRGAFVADMAAAKELESRYDDWHDLPMMLRSEMLGGLRLFLEECPICGGRVTLGQRVVKSCCRSYDVVATSCQECGARLFETEIDTESLEQQQP